jgi:hypothetical protein
MFKLLIVVAIAVVYTAFNYNAADVAQAKEQVAQGYELGKQYHQLLTTASQVQDAFIRQVGGVQVELTGRVIKLLPDDNEGARHQRFIVTIENGMTLLVAHNIDLAPRVDKVAVGDIVVLNGVYEWNAKGGVIHWTHHDPQGKHAAGWIRHAGKLYQ